MNETLKRIFKNNKTAIIVSVCTSLLTSVVLLGITGTLVTVKNGLIKEAFVGEPNKSVNNDIAAEESLVIDIIEKSNPAVVSIVVTKDLPVIERYYREYNPFGDGFGFLVPQQRQNGTEEREIGGGSGFLVSADGYVVTNRHVVDDDSAKYIVFTNDGKKYDAEILAKDSSLDVAVLKIKGGGFPYLEFGNSDLLKPGQTVIAIGNALAEFRNSVSTGIVSGLSRSIIAGDSFGNAEQLEGVIQTDAAINPGNSGGPLLDIRGNVIGVNVAVERGAENIGFALPSNVVKSIADSVRQNGEIVRPYLGVRYVQITESLKEKNNLLVDYGVLVQRGETREDLAVIPGSPADKAGITENDIILEINSIKLEQGKSLASIVRQAGIGQTVRLKILRKGSEKQIEVRLEKAPKNL